VSGAVLTHAGRRRSAPGCRPHPHVGWRSWRAAVPTPVVSRLLTHAACRTSAAGCRPHPHVGSRGWRAAVPSPVGSRFSVGCCRPISPLLTLGTWVIASAPGARHSVPPANHQAVDGADPAISNLAHRPRTEARCCTDPPPVMRTPPRWSTHHCRLAGRHTRRQTDLPAHCRDMQAPLPFHRPPFVATPFPPRCGCRGREGCRRSWSCRACRWRWCRSRPLLPAASSIAELPVRRWATFADRLPQRGPGKRTRPAGWAWP
jgi:hypothetical protein